MKKQISFAEYAIILTITGVLVCGCITGVFFLGSKAAVKLFDLPAWVALPVFLFFILIWSFNGRRK